MKPFRFRFSILLLAAAPFARGETSTPALSPDVLVAEVTASHPELRFYEAELAAARAGLRAAGSGHDPELAVEIGRKRVRDLAGTLAGEGNAWSVSLTQTFEWPGRLALRKAVANRDVALAELGLDRFRAELAARVHTLACGLFAAQEQAAAAAEVAERFGALKETFLARDSAGLTPLLETRVIEAQELALQRRATDAALAESAARTELNQLRGRPVDEPLTAAPVQLAFAAAPSLDALLAAAHENDFGFRARRLELEQQGYAVRLARHERRPAFSVGPYVSREAADVRETTVGLSLSVPLPLSSGHRAAVDTAESRRRQAEAAVAAAQWELDRAIVAAAQAFEAKRTESARWSPESVAKFREAAALADRHYRLGAVPLATYIELQTAYLDAMDALLATQREALDAGLRLQLLTGLDFGAVTVEAAP